MFYAALYAFNAWRKMVRERRWVRRALNVYARNRRPVYRGRWE